MKLPKITTKQHELLRLFYRYRFLERSQIQAFLHHKDKRRSSSWLKDLREKHYIEWIYSPDDPIEKTKPAIYYLGLSGIRYLRDNDNYPPEELRKRYKESTRKSDFITRCLLVADCCLNAEVHSVDGVRYSYVTQTDYADEASEYHFLVKLQSQLCFTKQKGGTTINYLFEIFDSSLPNYQIRKRLREYVEYLSDGEWGSGTGDDESSPIVLLACPTIARLIYAKRYINKLLEDIYDDSVDDDIHIRLSTTDQVRRNGVTGKIWEEV